MRSIVVLQEKLIRINIGCLQKNKTRHKVA